jgi:small subunit ribosomal protein S5
MTKEEKKTAKAYKDNLSTDAVESTEKMIDEFAEKPEDVLDEKDLKELEELEKEAVKPEEKKRPQRRGKEMTREELLMGWDPKTKLGIEVQSGKIKNIDEILDKKMKILEPQIVDTLVNLKTDLIAIGQSKGKFGGGKRRAWRQTQRKTKEGNVPTFSTMAVIGDGKGHVGIGVGKSMETLPARDKAVRKAKLSIIKVIRGDGSFDSVGGGNASIPFKISGKAGSVRVTLMPAAPGTGLVVADQMKLILKMAGIEDVYSKTEGKLKTAFNLAKATIDALKKTNPIYENKGEENKNE